MLIPYELHGIKYINRSSFRLRFANPHPLLSMVRYSYPSDFLSFVLIKWRHGVSVAYLT